jgi:hypothetical protein
MRDSISIQIVMFFRFMRLFRTTLFSILKIEAGRIHALVAWEEDCRDGIPDAEDTQRVLWICDEDSKIDDALTAGEYAYDAGWIDSDRLSIEEGELQESLGWDIERTTAAVKKLTRIRVLMIDDGEETDSFFLHQ